MEVKNEDKNKRIKFSWKVYLIFAIAIFLICGFVFIHNYSNAYNTDTGGGWLAPSDGVVVRYIFLALFFIFSAIVLKVVFKKKVRILVLLFSAVLLPIILYNVNYYTLKKDGPFYSLVDEGGIFHFIAIGDYNFDGMNDEQHHILYDEREYSMRYGGHFDDVIINYIDTTSTGTGPALNGTFCFYDWEEKVIDLHLNRDKIEFKEIRIIVAFKEQSYAENASFYLNGKKLNATKFSDRAVKLVFDAEDCAKFQRTTKERIEIPIKYTVN